MTAGSREDLTAGDARRFAFILGTPAFAGAALLELPDQVRFGLIEGAAVALLALGLGMAVNQVIGAAWAKTSSLRCNQWPEPAHVPIRRPFISF